MENKITSLGSDLQNWMLQKLMQRDFIFHIKINSQGVKAQQSHSLIRMLNAITLRYMSGQNGFNEMCSNVFTINGVGYQVTGKYRVEKRFASKFVDIRSELFTSIWLNLIRTCFKGYSNNARIHNIAFSFVKKTYHSCMSKSKPISITWKYKWIP